MADGQLVRFPPGTLVYYPNWSNAVYMYLEGVIEFGRGKIQLRGAGAAVEIKPVSVSGKAGGSLLMEVSPGSAIHGEVVFAGDYLLELPGSRGLLIRALPSGLFQFFLGPKGGIAVQLHPVDFRSLQFTAPAPSKRIPTPRASPTSKAHAASGSQ